MWLVEEKSFLLGKIQFTVMMNLIGGDTTTFKIQDAMA